MGVANIPATSISLEIINWVPPVTPLSCQYQRRVAIFCFSNRPPMNMILPFHHLTSIPLIPIKFICKKFKIDPKKLKPNKKTPKKIEETSIKMRQTMKRENLNILKGIGE